MDMKTRILAAATEAFEREGLEGLSMRKVAARVGLTPMALYRHYADKDALIDALVLQGLDSWRARLAALPPCEPLAWLEQMAGAFLDFALEQPRRFEAAFQLRSASARRFPDDFTAGRSPPGTLVLRAIDQAKAQGLLGDAPPAEATLSLWAMAQGLVDLYRAGRFAGGEAEFRTLYRSALARCLASFKPGAPAR